MHRPHRRLPPRPAALPGALAPLLPHRPKHTAQHVTLLGYGPDGYEEIPCDKLADIPEFSKRWAVTWISVDGLGNPALILKLGEMFGIDRLALEDIFDTAHLQKIEEYENYLLILLKGRATDSLVCEAEQVSIILMPGMIITFQEKPTPYFAQVRTRIRAGTGRARRFGSDYLAYALVDALIEGWYPVLDSIRLRLDAIEDTFLLPQANSQKLLRQIHDIKNELLFLHGAAWPIYDITLALAGKGTPLISKQTAHYLRDCQDQARQVRELSEFYRLIASDLMSTYLAFNNNKANEIMKVLTIVTTIFIPLSFIASIYGMNFNTAASPYNMPELNNRFGYPIVLSLMGTVAGVMLLMFWRRGWFTGPDREPLHYSSVEGPAQPQRQPADREEGKPQQQ